jgi:DNA-directed RNA polymerase subunit L
MEIGYHEDQPVYDVLVPDENWTLAYLLRDTIDTLDGVDSVACDMVHPTSESNTIKLQIRMAEVDIRGIRRCIQQACESARSMNLAFSTMCSEKLG